MGLLQQACSVRGQSEECGKWIQCFNGATAILFVVACSSYNIPLAEDPTQNILEESLDLFHSIWSNRFLRKVPLVLLLNKHDLLRCEIRDQKWKLENYFSYQMIFKEKLETQTS